MFPMRGFRSQEQMLIFHVSQQRFQTSIVFHWFLFDSLKEGGSERNVDLSVVLDGVLKKSCYFCGSSNVSDERRLIAIANVDISCVSATFSNKY